MSSTAIRTMNDPAIPMSAARADFFLAHANEKQGQANAIPIVVQRRAVNGVGTGHGGDSAIRSR